MRTRILALMALIFALESSVGSAQNHPLPPNLKSAKGALVVDRLIVGRETLGLNPDQTARLTQLSTRLHHERGRPVITGLDRVPGKAVPRIQRIKTTAAEAFSQASAVLSPEQQAKAAQLLAAPGN